MTKKVKTNKSVVFLIIGAALFLLFLLVIYKQLNHNNSPIVGTITKPPEENFKAPGKDWPSPKKVEDYFVSSLHMTPEEAKATRSKLGVDGKVMLRLTENTTIDGLISNLEYYGFVRNKDALKYALENTTDTVPGHQEALKIGNNTVDLWAYYRISENMTAWEIADQLLNHPTYFAYDEYHYMFMP